MSASRRKPLVLVVDDDQGVRQALRLGLSVEGFDVHEAPDGEAGLDAIAAQLPSVVLLDVVMPGISGVEAVRRMRLQGRTIPVCMLSARDEVDDRVAGLAAGADDYVVKPFSVAELAARLHALVRLHEGSRQRPLLLGDLTIEPARREATRAGRELGLTTREFDLLVALAQRPGQVLSRAQLLEQVWGYTWDVDTNVVDVFIGYLRKKLEADGEKRILQTVRGVGFALRT
ncbi:MULTISPECIES: response regulator transcription factor [unclassified Streptomyces]|uniref:response regulator transcription factor n=1 Tax=unclassified Streptomyces TaxID=2593676 RepID=UPI0022515189|nr:MULTISPECIES: response regulator transcription factor [unclassified Streptomyces]MCX4978163.1 response regulator transcription factor [Streptomyces sp. NBC_00620]WUC15589.1 response regulator transcription factor [Streptomyces sp. NBC_00564]WUC48005.1 response regulator transcription factor [Streptomyces sp. NBC_00554]